MGDFAMQAVKLRLHDWAHLAPWSWVNYWPNFLEGMSQARHPWRFNNYGDRREGVDGWNSPMVQTVQRALDPFLIVDTGLLQMNPVIQEDSPSGRVQWPYRVPVYAPGEVIERSLAVFNGALSRASFALRHTAHWDTPNGPVARAAQTTDSFRIQPGFHTLRSIRFTAPASDRPQRTLYLMVESLREGQVVYREDRIRFTVSRLPESATAVFAGADDQTHGNWRGRYGQEGLALAGAPVRMPPALEFAWLNGEEWIWEASTEDPRALKNGDDSSDHPSRRAACRYGETVSFSLDLGPAPRRLSLYGVDWDHAGRQMEVVLSGTDSGKELARHTVDSFTQGRWLTWTASGRITAEITRTGGNNAVVSGVFVDPLP
jgi:hypothetical protein